MCGETHFTLPTIEFIAGGTQTYYFDTYSMSGSEFDMTDHIAYFSVAKYNAEPDTEPVISKSMSIQSGTTNVIYVELTPGNTKDLNGKYIYQVMIRDTRNGDIEPPMQGIMYVYKNIDRAIISGGT